MLAYFEIALHFNISHSILGEVLVLALVLSTLNNSICVYTWVFVFVLFFYRMNVFLHYLYGLQF